MDLAAIITTLGVVVLQLITVSLIISTRKMVRELANKKDTGPVQNNDRPRRDRDFRQNRRPTQDVKQKTQSQNTTSAAVDPVEKSLRDINLKLKNAERDQENARRKIHENFNKDQNRRRDGGKGGRDGRDGNYRRDRQGNWNERSRRDNPQTNRDSRSNGLQETQDYETDESRNLQEQPVQEISPVTENTPGLNPSDFGSEDNLQHGRKFSVKRRVPKEDESQIEDESFRTPVTPAMDSNIPAQDTQSQEKNEEIETTAEAEIRFGRR